MKEGREAGTEAGRETCDTPMMMEIFILNEFWYPNLFSAIPQICGGRRSVRGVG